jgi:hypothetical protein
VVLVPHEQTVAGAHPGAVVELAVSVDIHQHLAVANGTISI